MLLHALPHAFNAFQPLLQRLEETQQRTLSSTFGEPYQNGLSRWSQSPADLATRYHASQNRSWFATIVWENPFPAVNRIDDVRRQFGHASWGDHQVQQMQVDAYNSRDSRHLRESQIRQDMARLIMELKKPRQRALQQEQSQLSAELKLLESEDALLLRRIRRYRLKPSVEQAAKLKQVMHACRFTYNKCVEYERKTGKANKALLQKLFVTRQAMENDLVYSEGMGPSPEWVLQTPASIRQIVVRKFSSAISAAHTNLARCNSSHFTMRFKSRKQHNYFTIGEHAQRSYLDANIHRPHTHHSGPAPYPDNGRKPRKPTQFLTITSVPNIPIIVEEGTTVEGEVVILYKHGYWYARIPYVVEPQLSKDKDRCNACDPGLKAFLTCMDLHGDISHIGRANWTKLDRLRKRLSATQRGMSAFANVKKVRRHTGEDWKRYVAARREFSCASAKLESYIKDLHFQAAAYLCKNSDVILLPKFDSKSMLLQSAPWTHKFNSHMQTLAHFQFRQRLLAKCAVLGKILVLCSEMYTSRTCGRCNRLHLSLRNLDVFVCPHCGFVANRDENAAFNIMRFVCAGSVVERLSGQR